MGFEVPSKEDMLCLLKKSLYGLNNLLSVGIGGLMNMC